MGLFSKKVEAAADTVAAATIYAGEIVAGEKGAIAASKVTGAVLRRELDVEGWRSDKTER